MTKQVSKSTTRSKKAKAKSTSKQKHKVQGRGYCIRCATGIDFSTDKPLCDKDYTIWAEHEDPEFAEEYCHSCGKEKDTSYAKPLCITCFKKIAKGTDAPKRSVPPWFKKKTPDKTPPKRERR
jgi:ribosomal protein S14